LLINYVDRSQRANHYTTYLFTYLLKNTALREEREVYPSDGGDNVAVFQ